MIHLAKAAVPLVLGAALAVSAALPAAAFDTDRGSWINHLQEERAQRRAAAGTTPPMTRQTGGYQPPEVDLVRPGTFTAPPRAAAPATAPARRTAVRPEVQQAALQQVPRQPDPRFLPQVVAYSGPHEPGTIVVDTSDRFLYLVQPGGTAIRYGVGVGRQGFDWTGRHRITMKREWPGWTPPPAMRRRQPELPAFMPGGPDNPLGARALYLGSTLYRIHGSNQPWTIGQAVSSGCIRMRNEDVTDLYERVKVGTMVVVQR